MAKVSPGVFRTMFPYFRRYRGRYLLGFLCLLVVDASQVLIPQILRRAIDLISGGGFELNQVFVLALAMVGSMAVISGGRFLWRYFINGSARRIETELRDRIFSHLLTLSWDFYQRNKIGDLMARSTNDLGQLRNAIGMGLVTLVDGTIMVAGILAIIFIQDARTAAMAVIPLPLITALILLFSKKVGKLFFRANETYSEMSDTVQETFAGIRVVKSFVKEPWFIEKFSANNDDYRRVNMDLTRLFGIFFPLITFLSGFSTVILILLGGRRVVLGLMTPGGLVSLFSYIQMLIWPLMGAGFVVNMIQRGAVSLERINEILNTEPSIRSPAKPAPARPPSAPVIEIRGLSFAYAADKPVLADLNLSVEAGTVLGILGRTGAGKSTLVKILPRMIDPPPETVRIFGVAVEEWNLDALRGLFGVAPQDSYLFSDSIQNNIAYGSAEAVPAGELRRWAESAALDRDLANFSQGAATVIGERGLTLSGGQKQRVAIARALALEPEILILDDAFSAVDAETERRILRGVLAERRGRGGAAIIVSHRISTLMHTDRVIVLEEGRIGEEGPPALLASGGGFFARMAALQQLEAGEGGHV
ncbi:MAG: ABC transporter ATP-binding protein/permease [Spirochaetaceae bacterium]|jgi:ATP-binding cassette subfamily B protein|nr:ABC transporter ATP-binding protein/permease [Spirochaetaceae bacterium]